MIEKIDITNAGIVSTIQNKLNKKDLRNAMFASWATTLAPGQEYDLGTASYGMYLMRSGNAGSTALYIIGAGPGGAIVGYAESVFATDFNAANKIILGKKEINGNIFVKNTRDTELNVSIMQITNY